MKLTYTLALLIIYTTIQAQPVINERYHFGFPAAIGNSLLATDSCYYMSGVVADTNLNNRPGNIFTKVAHDGNIEYLNFTPADSNSYEVWNSNLIAYPEGFMVNGYAINDELMQAMVLFYDENGQLDTAHYYKNFFSEDEFIISKALLYDNGKYYLACHERNPSGINNAGITVLCYSLTEGLLWRKAYFGGDYNEEESWCMLKSGDNIIIGASKTNVNLVHAGFTYQTYILAIDTLGNIEWQYLSPDTILTNAAHGMVREPDGSLIIASGYGEEWYVNPGNNNFWWVSGLIYKLSPQQEVEWEVEFTEPNGSMVTQLSDLVKTSDGSGYVAAGNMYVQYPDLSGDLHGWLVKVSPQGDSLWSRKLRFFPPNDGRYQHYIYDLLETNDGGFVLSGQALNYYDTLQIQQAWLLKVDEHGCLVPGCHEVGTQVDGVSGSSARLLVYPNPANDYLNVFLRDPELPGRSNAVFRLLDANGREVKRYATGNQQEATHIFPIPELPGGLYLLEYRDNEGAIVTEKVVVW